MAAMMSLSVSLASILGLALCCAAALYAATSLPAVLLARRRRKALDGCDAPVSILKPLHGAEPRLYENLRSFCVQDHADFEILFGTHDAADPALTTARRLQTEFPDVDIQIVIDRRLHGRNHKVSNLANILERARHPLLVIADSDIRVGRDYLRHVCAPLTQAQTGIVTCLYQSRPLGGLWSQLGGQFIDEWFAPAVRLTHLFGSRSFAFGATIALRRETLDAIGGFGAIADDLADDYRLGELTRRSGLRTVLSDYVVSTDVTETAPLPLLRRELRWLRTIRSLNPAGYLFMVLSFNLAVAIIGALLTGGSAPALGLLAGVAASRIALHFIVAQPVEHGHDAGDEPDRGLLGTIATLPLILPRDALNLLLWGIGLLGRHVAWGGRDLHFDRKGLFRDPAA